jgi:hypothetical protein
MCKQLVLELVVGVVLAELLALLPSSLLLRKAFPLHQQVPNTATELST